MLNITHSLFFAWILNHSIHWLVLRIAHVGKSIRLQNYTWNSADHSFFICSLLLCSLLTQNNGISTENDNILSNDISDPFEWSAYKINGSMSHLFNRKYDQIHWTFLWMNGAFQQNTICYQYFFFLCRILKLTNDDSFLK